jgi:RNA polymerase sigma factor (sigma-70 family)
VKELAIERSWSELERLYREDGHRLWRALVLFSRDQEIASDAVSEAFTQALARGGAIRSPSSWIWRSAFRIARGELKARRRTSRQLPEKSYEMVDPLPQVIEALRLLSPKQRASVILHHYAGYSLGEVAGIIGSTAPAVGVHLHRGRARLKTLLEEPHD